MEDQLRTSRSSVPMATFYVAIVLATWLLSTKISQDHHTLFLNSLRLDKGRCTFVQVCYHPGLPASYDNPPSKRSVLALLVLGFSIEV